MNTKRITIGEIDIKIARTTSQPTDSRQWTSRSALLVLRSGQLYYPDEGTHLNESLSFAGMLFLA